MAQTKGVLFPGLGKNNTIFKFDTKRGKTKTFS